MKKTLAIAGAIAGFLVVLLMMFRVVGLNPRDRYPGMWLTGELVTEPVTDWSFAEKVPGLTGVQTRERALPILAHSVNTARFVHKGRLYVPCAYPAGVALPTAGTGIATFSMIRACASRSATSCLVGSWFMSLIPSSAKKSSAPRAEAAMPLECISICGGSSPTTSPADGFGSCTGDRPMLRAGIPASASHARGQANRCGSERDRGGERRAAA